MRDLHERQIDYLRISITERCNLRCVYCMPEGECNKLSTSEELSYEEIIKLVKAASMIGISKIKITGGEPLVRKDICEIVEGIKKIEGIKEVTLTTNGILLDQYIEKLANAKLDGLNISLDTLDPIAYKELTRCDGLQQVLAGIKEAIKWGIPKVKINAVAIQELNKEDLTSLVELARMNKIHVRFIELMPIGWGENYTPIHKKEIMEILEKEYGEIETFEERLGNGPAKYYTIPEFVGKIGFISPVSHEFCKSCNRVRVTANGYLKLCLHYSQGISLKEYLLPEIQQSQLEEIMKKAIKQKPSKHSFNERSINEIQIEKKRMSQIGG